MLCSTDSADPLVEFSEFNVPLKKSFHILTISEPPFAPPTNVGIDEDLLAKKFLTKIKKFHERQNNHFRPHFVQS